MNYTPADLWFIILALGLGTFLIRFSFLGILGDRQLPPWLLRHLRYTAVGILPAMVTPLILWPEATGGQLDPVRIIAAALALGVGLWTKNAIWAIVAGMATLWGLGFIVP
ncbi:AzlD domain-containing protein [Roseicyclus mahoneyensis]|uniref:Branched-subunit amino acid transport protein n=1 Tax=Roseicyclus mahoneyensis TaxID=164332 RepID=A0A316GH84_9RHOB|nr:AzlD domain-containing protein [Roseicyclus mahoneyensis]PWK60206.1 branched-subunit amino acid transport protein [Roseicyclus mahoneyensis]